MITRRSGRPLDFHKLATTPDGVEIYVIRNGVNIVTTPPGKFGIIDIEADEAVIWRGPSPQEGRACSGPNGEWVDDAKPADGSLSRRAT